MLESRVHRGTGRSAALHVIEMTELRDQILVLLEKKFGRSYKTSAPIKLVAYYITQPRSDRTGAMESVATFVSRGHQAGD